MKLLIMKLDNYSLVIVCTMYLLVCDGVEVKDSDNLDDISGKSIIDDTEASGKRYAFSRRGNGLKRYDTIGGRRSDSFEPFVKADGFGSSDVNVASSNYGFYHPTGEKSGNIGQAVGVSIIDSLASGTSFDVQSSLRRFDAPDSSPSNIGGFDYDGSDDIHFERAFVRRHGQPRRTKYRKILKNEAGYGGANIEPISTLRENNSKKLTGAKLFVDNVVIPGPNYGGMSPGMEDDKSNYAFGDVSRYKGDEETDIGEQLAEGYEVTEDFDKDEKEAAEKSRRSGYREEAAGSEEDRKEENLKYTENESAAMGSSGENYGKNESHEKGHKTSGFHNVYHKDEYKKDTSFYDNERVDGREEKYDSENSQHEEAEGEQENVQKLDAGYHENEQAEKEVFLNGHQYGGAEGHDREVNGERHYTENVGFFKMNELRAAKGNGDSLYSKNYY